MSCLFGPRSPKSQATLMARTTVPEQSHSFVRSNSEPGARKHNAAAPAVSRPERPFEAATHELLGLIEQAVARIEQGAGAEAALRDISATLLGLKAMVVHDPGIKMAADDLYESAAALVAARSVGPAGVDVRRWRLLKEADARLRDRLASAQPSEKARLLGLN
jgi:hypothetical protein